MPLPTTLSSYPQEVSVWQRLDMAPAGLRIPMPTSAKATIFRARLYQARKLMAKDNAKVYPAHHPLHGATPYDGYKIKLENTTLTILKEEFELEIQEILA